MINKILFGALLFLSVSACSSDSGNTADEASASQQHLDVIASTVKFKATDSVELVYHPDPKDEKIYKNSIVKDTAFINSLVDNLSQSSINGKECIHKMKFYLFRNGDVYKTIYMSDSCNYLAYAQNAKQVYIPLNGAVKNLADSIQRTMN